MSDFEVETEEHESYTALRPHGDIDAYSVGQFREALSGSGRGASAADRPVRSPLHGFGWLGCTHWWHPPQP